MDSLCRKSLWKVIGAAPLSLTLQVQGFRLSSYGESILLTSNVGTIIDSVTFPTSANGVSMGRTVSSHGVIKWPLMTNKTKGIPFCYLDLYFFTSFITSSSLG